MSWKETGELPVLSLPGSQRSGAQSSQGEPQVPVGTESAEEYCSLGVDLFLTIAFTSLVSSGISDTAFEAF